MIKSQRPTTPDYSLASRNKSSTKYEPLPKGQITTTSDRKPCVRCKPIFQQLTLQIDKLQLIRSCSDRLIQKKQDELVCAFKLLEEAERRSQQYLGLLKEREKECGDLREKIVDIQEAFQQLRVFRDSHEEVVEYLKSREYNLLEKIKIIQKDLIYTESQLEAEKRKNAGYRVYDTARQEDESIGLQHIMDRREILGRSNIDRGHTFDLGSIMQAGSRNRESMGGDDLEKESTVRMLDRVKGKLGLMQQEQKLLMLRNQVLEHRLTDVKSGRLASAAVSQSK